MINVGGHQKCSGRRVQYNGKTIVIKLDGISINIEGCHEYSGGCSGQ